MTGAEGAVVVTGAASGIGRATVEDLLDAGASVVGVDLVPRSPIEAPGRLAWVGGDVRDPATWDAVGTAWSAQGEAAPGALVHCAAALVEAPFLQTPVAEWRRLFDVNVIGAVRAIAAVLPAMIAAGRGAIVVVCSVDSLFADDRLAAYATSKAALLAVVRAAAVEAAGSGVAVNAVCPGSVETPLLHQVLDSLEDPDAALAEVAARIPRGALTRPREVADAIAFLRRPASGNVGSALVLDGGLTTAWRYRDPRPAPLDPAPSSILNSDNEY